MMSLLWTRNIFSPLRRIMRPGVFQVSPSVLGRNNIEASHHLRTFASEADIALDPKEFQIYRLDQGPSTTVHINPENAKLYYKQMVTIRRIEVSSDKMYKAKLIRGFCHLYTGQEAVAVGIKAAMRKDDYVITSYRAHGWYYLMGLTPYQILAEQAGRKDGAHRGKGGSMHMYSPNFFGGNGIVGAQVGLGSGLALASMLKGDGRVTFAAYGDGAANQGQVFECFNMGCLWKLPVVYVCENNLYGMGTAIIRSTCIPEFYKRGNYIPGILVDGMDVMAVKSAAAFAIDFVLKNGPIVIEAVTYRYHGHSMSDGGLSYRTREEVKQKRDTSDPISTFKQTCIEKNILSEEDFKQIDSSVKEEVKQAEEKAVKSPEPATSELYTDMYMKNWEPKIRGPAGTKHDHLLSKKSA